MLIERLIEDWRACQQRVNELEREYAVEMLAYSRGEQPSPPGDEVKAKLLALRKEANELLSLALREIDRRVTENQRGVTGTDRARLATYGWLYTLALR